MIRAHSSSAQTSSQDTVCDRPFDTNTTGDTQGHALTNDRIAYIADMIQELAGLARESKCATIAGLLALAHLEACQQSWHANIDKPVSS